MKTVVLALTLLPAAAAADDGLGRLFTTAAERQQLDRQRAQDGISASAAKAADLTGGSGPPVAAAGTRRGFVRRANGELVVWFDHSGTAMGNASAGEASPDRPDVENGASRRATDRRPGAREPLQADQVEGEGARDDGATDGARN